MKRFLILTVAITLAFACLAARDATASGMKSYVMVFLWRGESAQEFDKEQLAEIQRGHMATINRLAEEKKLVIAGPFGDDGDLRGIFVLDVPSIEEAEALVAEDPAIKAGRLRAEFKPWWASDRLPELIEPKD